MSILSIPLRRGVLGRVSVVSSLLIAASVAWAGGAFASPRPTGHQSGAAVIIAPSKEQVARVITPATPGDPLAELQLSLMSRFGASFGGIYVNASGAYVVATDGPAPRALEAAAITGFRAASRIFGAKAGPLPAVELSYVSTGASLAALYYLKAAILDNPVLRADGVDGAGVDIEHGRVVVMSSTSRGAAAAKADYGSRVLVISDKATGLTSNRYADSAPWNGGDQIVTPSFGETTCSSGFGVENTSTGQTYMITAGHCGAATWYNTKTNSPVYNSSTLIGKTLSGSVSTSIVDAQLITADTSCVTWGRQSTKNSNAYRIYITGYDNPPQGAAIETEGATTLELTGTVAYYDVSRVVGGENLSDLDLVTAIPDGGDSGGPLVYPTIYGPLAGGTLVGWYENSSGDAWGVAQLIDSELYTFTADLGNTIVPITSSTGSSC